MSQLQGKTALITGGNSGIGLATAQTFIDAGARVLLTGRRANAVQEAVAKLGEHAQGFVGDVSKLTELDALYAQVAQKFGKLDILFANAGVAQMRHLSEVDEAFFDQIVDINFKGLYFTIQKALPHLNPGASIILNGSVVAQKGFPNFSVYAATKAAVRSLARSWAQDLKNQRIRVNTLSPGPIETPIYSKMGMPEAAQQEFGASIVSTMPLGRFGQAHEIAQAALYLASDQSSFVTGIDLPVDGGIAQV